MLGYTLLSFNIALIGDLLLNLLVDFLVNCPLQTQLVECASGINKCTLVQQATNLQRQSCPLKDFICC